MPEDMAYSWLFIFYNIFALLMIIQGAVWLFRPAPFYRYLVDSCRFEHRPPALVKSAYALFFLGSISLIAAFFLRSGADIIFNLGLIVLSYKVCQISEPLGFSTNCHTGTIEACPAFFTIHGHFPFLHCNRSCVIDFTSSAIIVKNTMQQDR